MSITTIMPRGVFAVVALIGVTVLAINTGPSRAATAQAVQPTPAPFDHRAEQAYWAQRRGPITAAEYQAAQQQAKRLPQADHLPAVSRPANGSQPAAASPSSAAWTSIGPAPIFNPGAATGDNFAGRVDAVAIDPTTSGASTTIYIGASGGGVWKSTNNGGSWTPLTDTQVTMSIGALAIDPNNHNIIYAGTGSSNQSGNSFLGDGVLKSTNGGASWTLLGASTFGLGGSSINRIAIDPHTGNIYVASNIGVFVSSNGGTTWTQPSGVPNGSIGDDLAINSAVSPSIIYALVRFKGLYRSSDGGVSFGPLTAGLSAGSTWDRSVLAMSPSSPGTLYLITSNGGTVAGGGFYTTNGGNSWTPMASLSIDITQGQPWYTLVLAVDPLNPDILYGGGQEMYYSLDAQSSSSTNNWQLFPSNYALLNVYLHVDQHALAFAPGCTVEPCRLYITNDGGVYYADNPGPNLSYKDLNTAPLAITEFVGGDSGINFSQTPLALGGTQDNGTNLYAGSTSWNRMDGSDGGFTQIDQTNSQIMYDEYIYGYINQSTTGGAVGSFNSIHTGLPACCSGTLFYAPYVLDRASENHLAIGTGNAVYETLNATGATPTWYQSSQVFGGTVSVVAISPNNSAVIYAGLDNGTLYKATNAHSGATVMYGALPAPPGSGYVSAITFDPTDSASNTVFVSTRNNNSASGGFYMTTTGGSSWQNITGTLPQYPVNSAIVYYSGLTRVLVVGTDFGVYFTTNDGVTWQGLNTGLPNIPVTQLALDKQQTTLLAYTYGRSVWAIGVPTITATHVDSIGIFRPSANNGTFYLRLHNSTGFADITVAFNPASKPYPVVGDWTGAGFDTVGIYNQNNGLFTLCTANSTASCANSANLLSFVLGIQNDQPLAGKWSANAQHFGAGVFRPSNGLIYLKNSLTTGFADYTMVLGIPGDIGLAGDWNGDSLDSLGAYRPSNSVFYLNDQTCNCSLFGTYQFAYGIGGDAPVVGDWTALGHDGLGLFRQTNGYTYLRNSLTTGFANITFVYGIAGDVPVAGHWQLIYPPAPEPGSVVTPPTFVPMPNGSVPADGPGD